ncbi:MAG: Uma2 family endonuclease [Coleofasciculaceae cyanobacterium SM2_1_6]|nr:Uma2 family endonuclease [Coleofasciculaceae cyanobacterium SM2_1_6]
MTTSTVNQTVDQTVDQAIDQTATKTYTPIEYFALEESTQLRHRYCNGEIIPMPGGTPNHNNLTLLFIALLMAKLKGKSYKVFGTDLRLWMPEQQTYNYPDVMVIPKPVELQTGRKDTVTNPILIAEVLSNSTKNYDRSEKFIDYRTIPSFQEYLLIDQYKPHVEQYIKQGANQWLMIEYDRLEDNFLLPSLGIEISLADLYVDIEF